MVAFYFRIIDHPFTKKAGSIRQGLVSKLYILIGLNYFAALQK